MYALKVAQVSHLDNIVVDKLVFPLLQCLWWERCELPERASAEDPDGAPRIEGGLELGLGATPGLLVRPSLVLEQKLPCGPPFRFCDSSAFPIGVLVCSEIGHPFSFIVGCVLC